MIMNKYLELKIKQSKEFRKLPMKVGFDKKQFEQIMKEWGSYNEQRGLNQDISAWSRLLLLKKGLSFIS